MTTKKKWTAPRIKEMKNKQKIACLTAVDYASAQLIDEAGIPLILVGDSLAMTVLGYETTLPITQKEMLHHTSAVSRGVTWGLIVADMPFLSYQVSIEQAIENAGQFLKEGGANAVKIEGGAFRKQTIETLISNGIPVMGHIGLTPQSIHAMGGYNVQGKTPPEAKQLIEDAKVLADAGVFALVLECLPAKLAKQITTEISVPTIGIGAGPYCDGQILVMHDMLGMFSGFQPKFVNRYAEIGQEMRQAFSVYRKDVEQGNYPAEEHCY